MTRHDKKRLRDALIQAVPPDDGQAEERGWQVVREAFGDHEPSPRRFGSGIRAALAVATAGLVAGFALTPAGADVREWIADAIDVGEENARPVLGSLPTEGSVLVESRDGVWVLRDDGSRRHLGGYEHATWSPNGLYVGASRDRELFALTPQGDVRWAITASARIRALEWSADEGYRVAFVAGGELRVVAGNGTGEPTVVDTVASRAIAWRPESLDGIRHQIAYVDEFDRVVLADTDSGQVLWRSEGVASEISSLQWSEDGERLLVELDGSAILFDAQGNSVLKGAVGTGTAITLAPAGDEVATVRADGRGQMELVIADVGIAGRERVLYPQASDAGDGAFGPPEFSPDGEWILLPWPQADQWLFIRIADQRVVAVADISRQLDPNLRGDPTFPRIVGWCC